MPVRVFWLLAGNLDRVAATEDSRALAVAAASQSKEGVEAMREELARRLRRNDHPAKQPEPNRDKLIGIIDRLNAMPRAAARPKGA